MRSMCIYVRRTAHECRDFRRVAWRIGPCQRFTQTRRKNKRGPRELRRLEKTLAPRTTAASTGSKIYELTTRYSARWALDILGLRAFVACDNIEGHFIAFIEHLETATEDGSMVHKHVLAGILSDESEALFIVPPFYFATG